MKWILNILLWMFCLQLQAQNPLYIHMAEDGIYIRWQGVRNQNFKGYNVYRKTGAGGNWELLNSTPLTLVQSSAEAQQLVGNKSDILYGLLEKSGGEITAQDLVNASEGSRFFESSVIVNPELAWMLAERYTDKSAERNSRYAYKITWLNGSSEIDWHESSLLQPYQPEAVPGAETIETHENDGQISLNMKVNTENLKSGDAITWNVYRSDSANGNFKKLNYTNSFPISLDSGEPYLSFKDGFLTNGKTYYYKVKMLNVTGNESKFSRVYALTPKASSRAGILNFTLDVLASKALIQWHIEQKGADIQIWRKDGPDSEFKAVYQSLSVPGNSRWIDNEFTSGVYYHYYMATEMDDQKFYSDTLSVLLPDISPPPPPTNIEAVVVDSQYVKITWSKSPAEDIAFYEIERLRSDHERAGLKISDKNLVDTVFVHKIHKGALGSNYYRLFAIDKSYNYSKGSELVKVKLPDNKAPQSPNLLKLYTDQGMLVLEWSKIPDQDLAYFQVLRGKYGGELSSVAEVTSNSYSEQTPDSGRYIFSVSAVDTDGNKSAIIDTLHITIHPLKPQAPQIRSAVKK